MAKSTEICKVINCKNNPLFLVSVMAEIQPLLKAYGLGLQKGIVIFLENSDYFNDIQQHLKQAGAVPCKSLTTSKRDIINNCVGVHIYDSYDKEAEIAKFLSEDGFTPALLIHSVIPDFLRDCENLVVVEENIDFQTTMWEVFENFQNYIHKSPRFIENSIRIFKGSEFYLKHQWKGPLNLALQTSAEAFLDYYRQSHTEMDTKTVRTSMHGMIEDLMAQAECCSGEWDNMDAVKMVVLDYLEANLEILIGERHQVEGALAEALRKDLAVLCDDTAYYFPEKVFRQACQPLFDMVSFGEIKRELKEEGFLDCNRTAEKNFTIKIMVRNAFGCNMRLRFLKIRREFFDCEGELTLQERRGTECGLELPMGEFAE